MNLRFNLLTVILLLLLIGVVAYFLGAYTPAKVRAAEAKYAEAKAAVEEVNKKLDEEIRQLEQEKTVIQGRLLEAEKQIAVLKTDLEKSRGALIVALNKVRKMTDDEVVRNTRIYLNAYLEKSRPAEAFRATEKDLYLTPVNAAWSFPTMKVNLEVLVEHNSLKLAQVPVLEEWNKKLETQKSECAQLVANQEAITKSTREQYQNEMKLRRQCEELNTTLKRQLRSGKVKSLVIGSGVGAGVVLLLSLLK